MIDGILAYYYDKNCYNIHAIKFSNPQTFLILLDVKLRNRRSVSSPHHRYSSHTLIMQELYMSTMGIDDPQKTDRLIVQTFMKELCRRDDKDNHITDSEQNRRPNVFPIEEIRKAVLGEYSLDIVKGALRGHMLENIGNAPLELLDGDANVLLTEAGRGRCHEYSV